jgi:hypothetical protein
MRPRLFLLAASLATTLACSNNSGGGGIDASTFLPAQDASMDPCTSQGGVCQPYTQSCPVLQQNTALCGDSVLICCLPEGGAIIEGAPDSGTEPLEASTDATGD